MKLLFSTEHVHPRDRLSFWVDEATRNFVSHEFFTPTKHSFGGKISVATLGNLDLAAFQSGEARLTRSPRHIEKAADDDVLLLRQVSGSVAISQDGREAVGTPGDLYILDPRRPFECSIVANTETLVCKIARSDLEARLSNLGGYTAIPISPAQPLAGLASAYLATVAAYADGLEENRTTIANHALDLIALAFETVGNRVAQLSSPRASTLLRLKSFIEANLDDPALKPAMAAKAAGISVRYASRLLAHEGSSLERYIVLRRLERCRQTLSNPAHSSRTIGDIAYSHGFSDLSHFARRFKEQFGCTPKEFRAQNG